MEENLIQPGYDKQTGVNADIYNINPLLLQLNLTPPTVSVAGRLSHVFHPHFPLPMRGHCVFDPSTRPVWHPRHLLYPGPPALPA